MTTELMRITAGDAAIADWQACAAGWLERKRARSGSERTAMIYERSLRAFFAHCRKECVLASKVWYELDHQGVIDSVHASLERLQTDHIGILQVHGRMYTPAEVEHVLTGGPLDVLLELRAAGKIGHIGITSEEPLNVIPFMEHEAIEVY